MTKPFAMRSRFLSVILFCAPGLGLSACGPAMDPSEAPAGTNPDAPAQGVPAPFRLPMDPCTVSAVLTSDGTGNYYPPEEGCEPPPSYPPPTRPGSLNYPPFSDKPSFTVSWGSSNGGGTYVTYQLEEQQGTGYWQTLYQGGGLSYTVSGRGSSPYRYRVRACSSGGCSTYFSGSSMIVSLPPSLDLYSEYPFLYAHDQENAEYAASTQRFRSAYETSQPPPVVMNPMSMKSAMGTVIAMNPPIVDGMFSLGQGFNVLKEKFSEICIDTKHPAFQIVSVPELETQLLTTHSISTDHLRQLLDVSLSGGLNVTASDFSMSVSAEKKRFVENVTDSYQETIVIRWARKYDRWTLDTAVEPLKADFVNSMLVPNNPNAAARFRERCGDKYVQGLVRGARLYMVFQFDAKRYSAEERAQHAASLKLALEKTFDVNGSNSVSQETEQLLTRLGVTVEAFATGGDESVRFRVNRSNFASEYKAYVDGTSVNNAVAVEHFLSHYDHPTQFLNYNYFQIFADYRVPLEQLRRWNAVDMELAERCELFNSYKNAANYQDWTANCRWATGELMNAKSRCLETLSWSGCVHPSSYYTISSGSVPQGSHLHSALGEKIKRLERATVTEQYKKSVSGGFWNRECASFTQPTCLPSSECAVDKFRTDPARLTEGYRYKELRFDSPGDDGNVGRNTYLSGTHCVNTYTYICTSRFGSTYAAHEYEQEIYGQCPQSRPFAIIP